MNTAQLLELYDREERRESVWPGRRREVTPHVIRQLDQPGRDCFINYSFLVEESADEAIEEEIKFFESLGQNFEWKVFRHDSPPDLKERLGARGFEIGEPEAIMALDLKNTPEELLRPVRHDVRRVTTPEGIREVVAVQDAVWPDNRHWLGEELGEELRRTPDNLSIYVAYVDGVPVSSAWVRFPARRSFASVWGGSTLPGFRRRGLYTALLAARVQEALSREFSLLTIDAGLMSRPIVEKFGFQVLTYAYECKWRVNRER